MASSLIADLMDEMPARNRNSRAVDDWEVECRTTGNHSHPHFLLSVRHRRECRRSRVLLTTCDWLRVSEVDAATRRLLGAMDSHAFGALLRIA